MPSDKKRVNLTIPDVVYERLRVYKAKQGIVSDATACLQLVTKQLASEEATEAMQKLFQTMSIEQLTQLSQEGLAYTKEQLSGERPAPPAGG